MKRVIALGAAAVVLALGLAGCGVRAARTADTGSAPVARTTTAHTTAGGTAAKPATPAGTTPAATTAGGPSTTDELNSINRTLTSLDHTLSGIDSQLTQADKADDSDN